MVLKEGDTVADRFYIIEDGELKATKAGVEGEVCPRMTRGAYFGEMALLNDKVGFRKLNPSRTSHLLFPSFPVSLERPL